MWLKKKTWIGILLFALITSIGIMGCLFLFLWNDNYGSDFTIAVKPIYSYDLNNGTSSSLSVNSITTNRELGSFYRQRFIHNFPFLLLAVLTIILISSFGLWAWMNRSEQKKHQRIAFDLKKLLHMDPQEDEEFYKEYAQIKEHLEGYQKDQERLHSYITHEQKNMIMLMKARLHQHADEKLQQDILTLEHSIDDVLTLFAHSDQEKEIVDLALLTAMECDIYRRVYPNINFSFDEDSDYRIVGKEHWLRRAIDNVLDNAIKYGEGKSIDVMVSQQRNTVILKIKDYGIGMQQAQIDEVFRYRYRIHNLQQDGYGIGLSLVQHVADLCDGIVWVDSELQKGSCFQLNFPLLT